MASTLTTNFSPNPSNARRSSTPPRSSRERGMFARLLQRFIDARRKQVERELARLSGRHDLLG